MRIMRTINIACLGWLAFALIACDSHVQPDPSAEDIGERPVTAHRELPDATPANHTATSETGKTKPPHYPEEDSLGKGQLMVPAEFRDGTADIKQAKAWYRATMGGSGLSWADVRVEQRDLVPGTSTVLVVSDPSPAGTGGRHTQFLFMLGPKGLRFIDHIEGSWKAVPPDSDGRPRIVQYWRLGGGKGTVTLLTLIGDEFVRVASIEAGGDDGASPSLKKTFRLLFQQPVTEKTLEKAFGQKLHWAEALAFHLEAWKATPILPADSQYRDTPLSELQTLIVETCGLPHDVCEPLNAFLARTKPGDDARKALGQALLKKIAAIRKAGKWSVCCYQHSQFHALLQLGEREALLSYLADEPDCRTCCGNDALLFRIVSFGRHEDAWPLLQHFAKSEAEGWLYYLNNCMMHVTGATTPPAKATTDQPHDKAFMKQAIQAWKDYLVQHGIRQSMLQAFLQPWKPQTLTVDGTTVKIDTKQFAPPVQVDSIPLNRLSRETPLETIVSLHSLIMRGEGENDLQRYANHFADPAEITDIVETVGGVDKWYRRVRHQEPGMRVFGLVRHRRGVLVVVEKPNVPPSSIPKTHVYAYSLVRGDTGWLVDESLKFDMPVLAHIHENEYRIVRPEDSPAVKDYYALGKFLEAHRPKRTAWFPEHAPKATGLVTPAGYPGATDSMEFGLYDMDATPPKQIATLWAMHPGYEGKPLAEAKVHAEQIVTWRDWRVLLTVNTTEQQADIMASIRSAFLAAVVSIGKFYALIDSAAPCSWQRTMRIRCTDVAPTYWPAGQGLEMRWRRQGFQPLHWKHPPGDLQGGEVTTWIMKPGYAPQQPTHADASPSTVHAMRPAEELMTWRGQRVFFWGGGSDWPSAKEDVMAALNATNQSSDLLGFDEPGPDRPPVTPEQIQARLDLICRDYSAIIRNLQGTSCNKQQAASAAIILADQLGDTLFLARHGSSQNPDRADTFEKLEQQSTALASELLIAVYRAVPHEQQGAEAVFLLASFTEDAGRWQQCRHWCNVLLDDYPDAELLRTVGPSHQFNTYRRLGDALSNLGESQAASVAFARSLLHTNVPRYHISGWRHLLQHDPSLADSDVFQKTMPKLHAEMNERMMAAELRVRAELISADADAQEQTVRVTVEFPDNVRLRDVRLNSIWIELLAIHQPQNVHQGEAIGVPEHERFVGKSARFTISSGKTVKKDFSVPASFPVKGPVALLATLKQQPSSPLDNNFSHVTQPYWTQPIPFSR